MSKDIHDSKSVSAFIHKLEPDFAKQIEAIRQLILSTDIKIAEQIKWNSPSFFYSGEMKPFNSKEYKRDIVVLNIRKGIVMLVFPTGAIVKDKTGLLEGEYNDGRRLAIFNNMTDVKTKGKDLQKVIKQWIKLIDK